MVITFSITSVSTIYRVTADVYRTYGTLGTRHFYHDDFLTIDSFCMHHAVEENIYTYFLWIVGYVPEICNDFVRILHTNNCKSMVGLFLYAK